MAPFDQNCDDIYKTVTSAIAKVQTENQLTGVIEIGERPRGISLRGELQLQLAVSTEAKPDSSSLNKLKTQLKEHLTEYDITISESSILAKYNSFQVQIFLYRAKSEGNHFPSDESYQLNNWILAEINRVKAFPIEKLNLVPICRILRFLSKKNSLLNGLTSQWIDVLVCKSFESARWPLTVGDGLRRVFGVISSGLLLFDKNRDGVCQTLSKQQRMDITTASQFLLRQMSFMKIPEMLDIERIEK